MVAIVADAGRDAGLGHLSRSTALAVALGCRGVEVRCFAPGADAPLRRDGIEWHAERPEAGDLAQARAVVVDSYRLDPATLAPPGAGRALVLMHDQAAEAPADGLVVAVAAGAPGARRLAGLEYACLRPWFWGLPRRDVAERAERILVTTGAGLLGDVAVAIAARLRELLPVTQVTVIVGPDFRGSVPDGVEVLRAPDSLADALLEHDLVVTAGGQTLLEAAAAGTPAVTLALVENQRAQAARLVAAGAAVSADDAASAAQAAALLAADPDARRALSAAGQSAVDGHGAHRVAYRVAALAAEAQDRADRSCATTSP